MNSTPTQPHKLIGSFGLALLLALLALPGCLDDIKEAARGALPFLPPSKFIERGGRKLTRAEAAYYQKLTDLSKAVKINPKDAVAYNAIGELLMRKGSYQLAKRCFQDAIDKDGTLSEPHHNLGRLYLLEDRYHGAMEELDKARKMSGDDAKIRTRLGQARAGLGQNGEALSEYDEAIALDNEYTPAYLEKARLLYSLGNFTQAAETCRTALQHIPPYEPPIAAKAKQTNVGVLDSLLPSQTITEDDSLPPTYRQEAAFDLALCLKAQGQYSEALSALVQADGIGAEDARADVGILRAKLQDLMGDNGSAIGTLTLLRTTFPEMSEIPTLLARVYEKSGQADLAAKTRLEAAELDHSDKDLQEEAARAAQSRNNKARLIAVYERLVRVDPEGLAYRIQLAQAYDDIGIKREAALSWQEVINLRARLQESAKRDGPNSTAARDIDLPPSDYEVRRRAGMLYAEMPGFQGKAMLQFKHCLEIVPHDPEVHRKLGELCLETKNYTEAETHIRQNLKVEPNDAKSHHNLATLHAAQGRYDDSVLEFRTAVSLDPNLEVAQLNLAKVLLGQHRNEEALQLLLAYTKLKPLDVEARKSLAELYKNLNRKDLAIAELEAVSLLESESGDLDIVLATKSMQWEIGDKGAVLSDLEAQIEKHPSDLRLLLAAGRYYTDQKAHVKAIYTWERVRGIATRDSDREYRVESNNRLSAEYLASGQIERAIKSSEEAGMEGDADAWRRSAEMHLKQNESAKAAENYKEVLKLKSQDIDARKRLATLLQSSPKVLDREAAMTLYHDAATINPKDETARVNYATLLGDFNRVAEALEEYDTVLQDNPNNTSALVGRGVILRKKSRFKESLACYLKAIEIDPDLPKAYFNAALIYDYYLTPRDAEKARFYYDKYLEHGGDPAKLGDGAPAAAAAAAQALKKSPANNPTRSNFVDTSLDAATQPATELVPIDPAPQRKSQP